MTLGGETFHAVTERSKRHAGAHALGASQAVLPDRGITRALSGFERAQAAKAITPQPVGGVRGTKFAVASRRCLPGGIGRRERKRGRVRPALSLVLMDDEMLHKLEP